MASDVKIIASLADGRVTAWFATEDPIPEKWVVVPEALYEKYKSGEIADGKALAKTALMQDGSVVGTAKQNVAPPPPPAKGGDADPGATDPETVPKGEPTPETAHFPKSRTMRA